MAVLQPLGKITRIEDLRKVWKNEATDFTPWLAQAENLQMLGETLDINLELVETESSVGGYSLDILAEDKDSGEVVVIENQLEQTNHDHLGKLITYAAGKKAKKIIWIVKNVRDEHKSAIEWLNENTSDELQFFLLEIQLWQIGKSEIAPKFEIIEQPNSWANAVKASSNTSGGAAVQFKYSFWSAFNDYIDKNSNAFTKQFKKKKATSDHWYTLSVGTSLRSLPLLVNTKTDIVTVELTLNNGGDKSDFDKYYSYKDQIEEQLGTKLVWKKLDNKKVSRILWEHKVKLANQDSWNSIFDWYMMAAVKMLNTFKPYFDLD